MVAIYQLGGERLGAATGPAVLAARLQAWARELLCRPAGAGSFSPPYLGLTPWALFLRRFAAWKPPSKTGTLAGARFQISQLVKARSLGPGADGCRLSG